MLRKTALTAYGLVDSEWLRVTAAITGKGQYIFVRADGHGAVIGTMPTAFRTSGDVSNVAASMVDAFHMAALPASLPAHAWKTTLTLEEIASKMAGERADAIVAGLKAAYGLKG
jgi:hypothetical protein